MSSQRMMTPRRGRRPKPSPAVLPIKGAKTWTVVVEEWIKNRGEWGASKATLSNYRWLLLGPRSSDFRAAENIESPADFTAEKLSAFQGELREAKLSPATVHAFHRSHKTFLGFASSKGYGVEDAVFDVKAPKQPEKRPPVFSAEEEKRLLSKAARNPRDAMLIEFLLHTGMRLAEVCAVTLDDIMQGPTGDWIRVTAGKGGKDRAVPMDDDEYKLSAKVNRFVKNARGESADRHLFLAQRRVGGKAEYAGLSPRAVQMIVRRLGEEADVDANPHKFRHSFGTRAIAGGKDPITVSRVMGHTTLAMTNRYVQYDTDSLVTAWGKRRG